MEQPVLVCQSCRARLHILQPEAQAGREDTSGAAVLGDASAAYGNQAASLLVSTQLEESFVLLDSRARRARNSGTSSSAAGKIHLNLHVNAQERMLITS